MLLTLVLRYDSEKISFLSLERRSLYAQLALTQLPKSCRRTTWTWYAKASFVSSKLRWRMGRKGTEKKWSRTRCRKRGSANEQQWKVSQGMWGIYVLSRVTDIASTVNIFAFGCIYTYVVNYAALLVAASNSIVFVSISVRNSKREALN